MPYERMTIDERRKCIKRIKASYLASDRAGRGRPLSHLEELTDLDRKTVIRLLRSADLARRPCPRGRGREYGSEVDFSPGQPTSHSWALRRQRKRVPHENPAGRRVNALAVWIPCGPGRSLWWDAVPRTLRSADLLLVLDGISRGSGDLVVVLDNASLHRSHLVQESLPAPEEHGIRLSHLPPYSPELNAIEREWRLLRKEAFAGQTFADHTEIAPAVVGATARLNGRARPWVWGRPPPAPRYRRRVFTYRL